MCGHTRNPVIYSKFHQNPFRGFGSPGVQNLAFSITLASRFYNSLYYCTSRDTIYFGICLYCARAIQQTQGERAPQSDFVRLTYDGTCIWWPMYEQSVSHCRISVTKFPFDEQRCYLVYESWKYNSSQLNITSIREPESVNRHFQKSEQWDLLGTYDQTHPINQSRA